MPGFNQRAQVSGGASVTGMLRNYVANAAALVADAVQDEQEDFLDRQRERAEGDERWSEIAQDIHSWEDEHGDFAHGVRDEDAVSKASLLEYGDDKNPPAPLIRMGVLTDVANMRWRLTDTFRRGGY
jgi:hypothetical protein